MRRGSGSWPWWGDVRVDPEHHAGRFEAQEEVVERLGAGGRGHGVRRQPERHDRIGLHDGTVEHPGIRGRTHTMRSGSTPFANSHTIASVAVLPEPTITYVVGPRPTGRGR